MSIPPNEVLLRYAGFHFARELPFTTVLEEMRASWGSPISVLLNPQADGTSYEIYRGSFGYVAMKLRRGYKPDEDILLSMILYPKDPPEFGKAVAFLRDDLKQRNLRLDMAEVGNDGTNVGTMRLELGKRRIELTMGQKKLITMALWEQT